MNYIDVCLARSKNYLGMNRKVVNLVIYQLAELANIDFRHIVVTLEYIKHSLSFEDTADKFGLSVSFVLKIFHKTLPILVKFLKPFVRWHKPEDIFRCLPIPFRHRYHNVQCIIDTFEIEIGKAKNAVDQASTFSQYKHRNVVKYLVGATPNGCIMFVSPGYGGRVLDRDIVKSSGFFTVAPKNCSVLADRGFKCLENYGINFIVPPSKPRDRMLSVEEVTLTKQITTLRVHIKRVIKRLRDFNILKQRCNNNILKSLDHVVIVASALVNLDDPIFKCGE